jgi:hypothetical protein
MHAAGAGAGASRTFRPPSIRTPQSQASLEDLSTESGRFAGSGLCTRRRHRSPSSGQRGQDAASGCVEPTQTV